MISHSFVIDMHQIMLISLFSASFDHFHFHGFLKSKKIDILKSCHNKRSSHPVLAQRQRISWLTSSQPTSPLSQNWESSPEWGGFCQLSKLKSLKIWFWKNHLYISLCHITMSTNYAVTFSIPPYPTEGLWWGCWTRGSQGSTIHVALEAMSWEDSKYFATCFTP